MIDLYWLIGRIFSSGELELSHPLWHHPLTFQHLSRRSDLFTVLSGSGSVWCSARTHACRVHTPGNALKWFFLIPLCVPRSANTARTSACATLGVCAS